MSLNLPASTSNSGITPFLSLPTEERQTLIDEATAQKLIELFSDLLNMPDQSQVDSLEANILHRIGELKEQLNPELIHTIERLCAEKISPDTQTTETSLKTEAESFFNTLIVDQNNISSIMRYAYKNKSEALLQKCLDFIQDKTNVKITCQNFGPVSIEIKENNADSDLNGLTDFFPSIIEAVDRNNVQIHLVQSQSLSLETLESFVNMASDCIHTLNIQKTSQCDLNDDVLNRLLINCSNARLLSISSGTITEDGLRDLGRLTSLHTLHLSYCDALAALTLPNTLTSLHTLHLSSCNALTALTLPNTLTSLHTLNLSTATPLPH